MGIPLDKIMVRLPPERRARIEARAEQLIAEYRTLKELRKAQKLTQKALAKKLSIKQESVSNIESRSDLLISTLRNYVEAMGGQLSFRVTFPKSAPVEISSLGTAKPGRRAASAKKAGNARKRRSA